MRPTQVHAGPPRIRAIEHRGLRGSIRHGTVPLTPTIATHCHRIFPRYFPGSVQGWGIMSGHIPRPIGSIPLVATLLVLGVGISVPANIARADHCLSAPNSLAPQGSHWYYQLDWATQRKCWYMRPFRRPGQRAAASATLAGVTPVHSMPPPSGPVPADTARRVSLPQPLPLAPQIFHQSPKPPLAQRSAQEGNTAPSLIEAPAPQLSRRRRLTLRRLRPPLPWRRLLPRLLRSRRRNRQRSRPVSSRTQCPAMQRVLAGAASRPKTPG